MNFRILQHDSDGILFRIKPESAFISGKFEFQFHRLSRFYLSALNNGSVIYQFKQTEAVAGQGQFCREQRENTRRETIEQMFFCHYRKSKRLTGVRFHPAARRRSPRRHAFTGQQPAVHIEFDHAGAVIGGGQMGPETGPPRTARREPFRNQARPGSTSKRGLPSQNQSRGIPSGPHSSASPVKK